MKNSVFEREMKRAQQQKNNEPDRGDYWMGYMRGMRRRHHGPDFSTDEEHQLWLSASGDAKRRQRSAGYRDGYYGPCDFSADIAGAIRTLQDWRDWTVDDLAAALGTPARSGRTINGWRQGRVVPDDVVKTLQKIHTAD